MGFPTSLLVEHPGYATLQAVAFDQLWAEAKPYDDFVGLAPMVKGASRSRPARTRQTR
ncbi:MAG: hypothetical protein ACRD0Q_08965 [Acidimicrobiales bacterium]